MLLNTGANFKAAPTTMAGTKHENKNDGPTAVELAKRPRGRPPGSKNKPKPSTVITRETNHSTAFRPHVLEIPAGRDVIEALLSFSRRKSLSLCVLSCTGTVADVTLRQPPSPAGVPEGTVGLRGRVEVMTLSVTVIAPAAEVMAGVAVTVAGVGGQVVGGLVVGPLVAAGTVTVLAAAFERPTVCRLPMVEEGEDVSISGGGEEKGTEEENNKVLIPAQQQRQEQQHYVPREYVQHQRHHEAVVGPESCGMGTYSVNFPTEMIWAPVARPLQQRQPY